MLTGARGYVRAVRTRARRNRNSPGAVVSLATAILQESAGSDEAEDRRFVETSLRRPPS
jgi:hypothetical protein